MITLSKAQVKDADRESGIELLILWPAALGAEPGPDDLEEDEERHATPAEDRCARELLQEACRKHFLRIERVNVARIYRTKNLTPAPGENRVHLVVILIGQRWRQRRGKPITRWAQ